MPKDDLYDTHPESQVRSIIKKINDEHESTESSREVIEREDGTKVTKVRRRRRVMLSEKEQKLKSHKKTALVVIVVFTACLAFAAYYGMKLNAMGGSAYLMDKAPVLKDCFKADTVEMSGAHIEGTDMRIKSLILTYGQEDIIQRVELQNVRASFQLLSAVKDQLIFDKINVAKAHVVLRDGAEQLVLPATSLSDFMAFRRVECESLSVSYQSGVKNSPLAISNSQAYLYYPQEDMIVISLLGGQFIVQNWKNFEIQDLRAAFAANQGCEISVELLVNRANTEEEVGKAQSLSLRNVIQEGESFYKDYAFDSNKFSVSDFTNGRFASFMEASTIRENTDAENSFPNKARMSFSMQGLSPAVSADLALRDITWQSLPALQEIMKHMASDKRSLYTRLGISYGKIHLETSEDMLKMSFSDDDMSEPHTITLAGEIVLDAQGKFSGNLDYAIPSILSRAEYPDGLSDPIFVEEGALAWLRTSLSGTSPVLEDNSVDLELQAKEKRALRPEPYNLDNISVEALQFERQQAQPASVESKDSTLNP